LENTHICKLGFDHCRNRNLDHNHSRNTPNLDRMIADMKCFAYCFEVQLDKHLGRICHPQKAVLWDMQKLEMVGEVLRILELCNRSGDSFQVVGLHTFENKKV
jgi:hypothetical protein